MTSPLHNRIEQMMADLERQQAAVGTFQRDLAAAETTFGPKDRSISVTVDGQGGLIAVRFPSNAYRSMPAARLGRLIVETVGAARDAAREKAMGIFQEVLPEGLPVLDMLSGPVDVDRVMEQITEVVRDSRARVREPWDEEGTA